MGAYLFQLNKSLIITTKTKQTNQSKRAASSLNMVIVTNAIAIRQTTRQYKAYDFPHRQYLRIDLRCLGQRF